MAQRAAMNDNFSKRYRVRHSVTIYGKFRYNGRAYDVPLQDLSETGCRFFDRNGSLEKDTQIRLTIGGMGPFDATVRWNRQQYVGVEFDRPIYGPILEHIISQSGG